MRRYTICLLLGLLMWTGKGFAQKAADVKHYEINLYTDSLKKGFYNYINIDGQLKDGTWLPLDSNQLIFRANTGHFRGNDLFIDSSYTGEKVTVQVALRHQPDRWKEVVIYIRKRGFDEPLKSNDEILDDYVPGRRVKPYSALKVFSRPPQI